MSGIVDFVAPVKDNPYAEDVAALAEAGDGKAFILEVPVEDENKAYTLFRKAANDIDKTARLRVTDDSDVEVSKNEKGEDVKSGNVRLTFTLTSKHKARRGKKSDAA